MNADDIPKYITFVNNVIKANLPVVKTNPVLLYFVMYHIHSHSNSCRYHFGKFFTDRNIFVKLFPKNMLKHSKKENILEKGQVFFALLKVI